MPSSCFFWLCILSDDRPTGSWNTASPRMPHTLGEIFTHAQLLDFKNRNSWAGPGAANVLVDQHAPSCAASWDLISAASAVANCGWNYCWWINWQRILESWSSSSSLLRGWSARMATRWWSHHPARGMSLHVSSSATLSKSLRTPAPVDLTIHTFRTVDGTAGRRFAVVARFGKRWEFGDNREVCKAFVCPRRSCCSWGPAEAKRCMPTPRRLHMASVMMMWSTLSSHSADATFRRPNGFFFHLHSSLKT